MPRTTESTNSGLPALTDQKGFRHFGDGIAGEIIAARIYGFYPTAADYREVQVDVNGVLQTAGGAGGGGAATIADGADVAEGTTTDVAWVSGAGTLIAISKAEFAKLEAIRALLAGSLTVNVGLTDAQLRASAVPVSAAALTDGTQRGSIKLLDTGGTNVAAISAAGRLSVDASGVAVPVTDNAGSLTVDAPVGTPAFVRLSDGAAALIGSKVSASSLPIVIASDQASIPVAATLAAETTKVIGTVNAPALTKGTQGANGWSVQDLKDSGRVNIVWTAEFAHAQTAETLLTITESRDGAATTTASSKVVTNAKRLRITSIAMEVESLGTGTTPQRAYLRCRFNTAGAATTASALNGVWGLGVTTAIVKATEKEGWSFPDGIEFLGDGTKQIGFSLETPDWVVTTGTGRTKITITAFEY